MKRSFIRVSISSLAAIGVLCSGSLTPAAAQLPCAPLPPPQGIIEEVFPHQVDELADIVGGAEAGTTILLHDGFYDMSVGGGVRLVFAVPGVTLRSTSGDRTGVVLDGAYAAGELISIFASDVTIADLTLKRAYYHPIHISGEQGSPISGVVIHNIRLEDPGEQAIKINPIVDGWVDDGVIQCSDIELTPTGRAQVRNDCYTGGIDAHAASGWTVRRNRITGFWCPSGLSEHGIHFWRASRDTLVEENLILDCARGVGFGLGSAGGTRVYTDDPYPSVPNKGHIDGLIRNNFISASDPALFASGSGFDTGIGLEQATGARVAGNSVASIQVPRSSSIEWRFTSTIAEVSNNLTTHNLKPRDGAQASLQGNISGVATNWFVDVGSGDLHLSEQGAAAVDAGVPLPAGVLSRDFDHQLRELPPDVGADEMVDPIFSDAFESGDLSAWSDVN